MRLDLHTHTTASDGSLSPSELVSRAKQNNIQCISITDHDSVAAYEALTKIDNHGIDLVPGIELSTTWQGRNIHVLGLNLQLDNPVLLAGIAQQQNARLERACKIAERLKKCGVSDLLEKALKLANGATIGRPHFAQILVDEGAVATHKQAFQKHLGNGKPGDVRQFWASLAEVIKWIRSAGGTAVLAHPAHYNLTWSKLKTLLQDFVSADGQGIEVCNGIQTETLTKKLAEMSLDFSLLASCGSDFHNSNGAWSEVGKYSRLPEKCRPVWEHW